MKTALVTIAIGDFYTKLAEVTHPMMRSYAERIGAEFICIKETSFPYPHYAKFEIGKLLDTYDRVVYMDTDIIVSPHTPNIFDVVPEDSVGMLDESPLGYADKFGPFLLEQSRELYDIWVEHKKCYNAGVIVCSATHKKVFDIPTNFPNHYVEQSYLNFRLLKENVRMFDLPYQYNRMIYLDLLIPEHRLKSFIVHYAGFLDKRPIEECVAFLKKEYSMMLSGDFSLDDVKIGWAPVA